MINMVKLADVYFNNLFLNKWMLDNKYGVEYDGGTKIVPASWKQYQNNQI